MSFSESDIRSFTGNIWSSVFGLDLDSGCIAGLDTGDIIAGGIHLSGAWEGALFVECTPNLARKLASAMFGMDDAEITDSEVRDAIGEIANMAGGNFKALLPQPCQLSLPIVVEGHDFHVHIMGSEQLCSIDFVSEGEPVRVRITHKRESQILLN